MMEIRSSRRCDGNQIFQKSSWKSALLDTSTSRIRSSGRGDGNQVFRKSSWKSGLPESGLPEEMMEFSSSGRHDGNKIFQKSSWKSNLSEELMKISPSRRGNRNQLFWKY